MPLILIDGPEKSGKSTLIREIVRQNPGTEVRHWGPVSPDDRAYRTELKFAVRKHHLVVWDRAWPSEHVYANLLGRDRRLANDSWLGEWIHGRALTASGVGVILLGPDVETLRRLRDDTDLQVDPLEEREAFRLYGERYGYLTYHNRHDSREVYWIADEVVRRAQYAFASRPHSPPNWAGPGDSAVVIVGQSRNDDGRESVPGAWLPFTSKMTMGFARLLGDDALLCGWTNARDITPSQCRRYSLIVSVGEVARTWVHNYVQPNNAVHVRHPSYVFRWGGQAEKSAAAYREMVDQVHDTLIRRIPQ